MELGFQCTASTADNKSSVPPNAIDDDLQQLSDSYHDLL